jgi:hypothetical protein
VAVLEKEFGLGGLHHGGCNFEEVFKSLVFISNYLFSLCAQYFE